MNQLYHQTMEWRFGKLDLAVRIGVGLLAVAGVVTAFAGEAGVTAGIWVAVLSLAAAIVLNIVPFGDWAKSQGEMFRLWCDLWGDAEREHLKTCELDNDDKVPTARSVRLDDLCGKMATLNANQTAPWKGLLDKCHKAALAELGFDPPSQPADPCDSPFPPAATSSGS
jgi:hypothetical protein